MSSRPRLLVLDEQISPVLVEELGGRGRDACSVLDLELPKNGRKDWQVIRRLCDRFDHYVLVTLDDSMPKEWKPELDDGRVTVAVVASPRLRGRDYEDRKRDLVHRWAHAFQAQAEGSIRLYDLRGGRPWRWKSRSRVPKAIGKVIPRIRGGGSPRSSSRRRD